MEAGERLLGIIFERFGPMVEIANMGTVGEQAVALVRTYRQGEPALWYIVRAEARGEPAIEEYVDKMTATTTYGRLVHMAANTYAEVDDAPPEQRDS